MHSNYKFECTEITRIALHAVRYATLGRKSICNAIYGLQIHILNAFEFVIRMYGDFSSPVLHNL